MSGLDRIIDGILDDAKRESEKITDEARAKSDEIVQKATEKAEKIIENAKVLAENEYNQMMKNAQSASEITEKRLLLHEKQNIINDVIDAAKLKIMQLDDESYFKFMERLLKKCASDEPGEIILSEKDKSRVSKSFMDAAKAKGLKMSDETRSIDGGFVLIYGDIEENCRIAAIMESEKERLYDIVNRFLF